MYIHVAPLATAFIAIVEAEGRPIVASGDHALISHNYGAVAPLHAVGAGGGQLGQPHEVRVEAGANELWVLKVVAGQRSAEVLYLL